MTAHDFDEHAAACQGGLITVALHPAMFSRPMLRRSFIYTSLSCVLVGRYSFNVVGLGNYSVRYVCARVGIG